VTKKLLPIVAVAVIVFLVYKRATVKTDNKTPRGIIEIGPITINGKTYAADGVTGPDMTNPNSPNFVGPPISETFA